MLTLILLLVSCGEAITQGPHIPAVDADDWTGAKITADVQKKWRRTCALCHVAGEGGAPRMGDLDAWQPRLAQGRDMLLHHTITGLNRMPPLGYCMDCSEDDFIAMIRMMVGERP